MNRASRAFPLAVLAVAALGIFSPNAIAQIPPTSSTTSTPVPGAGHDYLGGQVDTVNPATGSVSVRIPVIMPPGRGITLPFNFAYDSNGVNYLTQAGQAQAWFTASSVVSTGGWSNTAPVLSVTILRWTTQPQSDIKTGPPPPTGGQVRCTAYVNYAFQDGSGNRHNLNVTAFPDPSGWCTLNQTDWPYGFEGLVVLQGSEGPIQGTIAGNQDSQAEQVTVTDGDGTVYNFSGSGSNTMIASSVVDRNGNTITISPSGNTNTFSYEDTTGRTAIQDSGFAVNPETVTVSGLGVAYNPNWTPLSTLHARCPRQPDERPPERLARTEFYI